MFQKILIEKEVESLPQAQRIMQQFPQAEKVLIEKVDDVFGRVKKPYLQKRENLNLFLGKRRGAKVKPTPAAYGAHKTPHYYFIHSLNCLYECQYCYLQGYFNSPDIVLYLNHQEILSDMQKTLQQHTGPVWFHSGEFSDSLALTHLTQELPLYHQFFKQNPSAQLEIRTKSANIRPLLELAPLENLFVSFSLSPAPSVERWDKKTASFQSRVKAIKQLINKGYKLILHFDPIIESPHRRQEYLEMMASLGDILSEATYLSLGVVRFSQKGFQEFQRNYPDQNLISLHSHSDKIKYPKIMRQKILQETHDDLISFGVSPDNVYWCMET